MGGALEQRGAQVLRSRDSGGWEEDGDLENPSSCGPSSKGPPAVFHTELLPDLSPQVASVAGADWAGWSLCGFPSAWELELREVL